MFLKFFIFYNAGLLKCSPTIMNGLTFLHETKVFEIVCKEDPSHRLHLNMQHTTSCIVYLYILLQDWRSNDDSIASTREDNRNIVANEYMHVKCSHTSLFMCSLSVSLVWGCCMNLPVTSPHCEYRWSVPIDYVSVTTALCLERREITQGHWHNSWMTT